MLIHRKSLAGVTLIELMIAIAIVGILLVTGLPEAVNWIQNTKIRSYAETISNGLQLARAEAVRRNTSVRFQLVDSLTNSCALAATGSNWVVSLADPSGACDVAPSDTVAPQIVQKNSSAEGSTNVAINSGVANVVFNGLGRTNPAVDNKIQITNPTGGACIPAGPMRCLNVEVRTGGQIRMCDPAVAAGDNRACLIP